MTTTLLDADRVPPTIRRSASATFVFPVTDVSVSPTVAKNLTGATEVSFVIGHDRNSPSPDLVLTLDDVPETVSHDSAGGNITVQIAKAVTETLPVGTRWCELWITDAAGRRELVGEGACAIHDTLLPVA